MKDYERIEIFLENLFTNDSTRKRNMRTWASGGKGKGIK